MVLSLKWDQALRQETLFLHPTLRKELQPCIESKS